MTATNITTPSVRTRAFHCTLALSAALALVVAFGLAKPAHAVVVTGNIYTILDGQQNRIGSTVDHWSFTVNTAGVITIDTLSWERDASDLHDGDTDTNETVDVNGDGEIAFLDTHIYLFNDDGSLDAGDLITAVDDEAPNTYGDGSIFFYDAYLSLPLAAGNYILAVGAFPMDTNEAITQFNDEAFYPVTADGLGTTTPIDHGDYQITFTGDVTVPEPSSLMLAAFGFIALAVWGWRRER